MLPIRIAVPIMCAVMVVSMPAPISAPLPGAPGAYAWTAEVKSAAFVGAYNFPVFVIRDEM